MFRYRETRALKLYIISHQHIEKFDWIFITKKLSWQSKNSDYPSGFKWTKRWRPQLQSWLWHKKGTREGYGGKCKVKKTNKICKFNHLTSHERNETFGLKAAAQTKKLLNFEQKNRRKFCILIYCNIRRVRNYWQPNVFPRSWFYTTFFYVEIKIQKREFVEETR